MAETTEEMFVVEDPEGVWVTETFQFTEYDSKRRMVDLFGRKFEWKYFANQGYKCRRLVCVVTEETR